MKIKLNDLLLARGGLTSLANAKGLNAVVAYNISKNIKVINEEIKNYEEIRTKLINEKVNKDKDGNAIINNGIYDIPKEFVEFIDEQLSSLHNEFVELDLKKVTLDDIEKVGLSPLEIDSIEFMLEV